MKPRGLIVLYASQLITAAAITLSVPKDGISARLGDEASLPCWVTPATNAEDMEVRWYQTFDNPVLLYRGKKIQISPVQADYDTCYASQSAGYDNGKVHLTVTVRGTPPLLSVVRTTSGSVNVSCESRGWHPQPRLQWSDGQQSLAPQSLSYSRDDQGLVGVHSWLVSSLPWVSCSLSLSPEEEREGRVDLKRIPAKDVPSGGWKTAFIILLVLSILTAIGVLLYIKKKDGQTILTTGIPTVVTEHTISCAALDDMKKQGVNITLDRSTATPHLTVSKDGKIVRDSKDVVFSEEEWFSQRTFILGEPGFSSGCAYWEVGLGAKNVDLKESWWVGLASETVKQQGHDVPFTPSAGFWFLSSEKGKGLKVHVETNSMCFVTQRPEILGVYLDYDKGEVSFYDVKDQKRIATLATKFTEKVFPLFNPGRDEKAPLKIIDVPRETKCKTEQDVELDTEVSALLKPTPSEMDQNRTGDLVSEVSETKTGSV
ncbi:butyrophilin subfamily 1 member A1-like [Hypomesus transpacificus]|uniref:butyrophilin subfamily 1 member A1-like n=1 Tax=Hypomesus transpacificus TaxID=137520 RepID=UPI001F076515|nr:butyrophilin subfamily 1 member A1-like [Hypomesus transpacificus]